MLRVWGRLWKKGRMVRDITEENDDRSRTEADRFEDCLEEIIREFDLPKPIWLPQNTRELDLFRQTQFRQEHFVESFPYDKLEIEIIEKDDEEK